jgi:hypothetical protein
MAKKQPINPPATKRRDCPASRISCHAAPQFTHPPIHQSTNPSIHQSINPSITFHGLTTKNYHHISPFISIEIL